MNCAVGTACAPDEYKEGGDCKACNNYVSGLMIAVSFLSFIAVTYYVEQVSTSRSKMVRLKVLSTFFWTPLLEG